MTNLSSDTISTLAQMTAPYGDRILNDKPLEITLWQVDHSTFAQPRPVKIVQTWTIDFMSSFYRCETDRRQRIDSPDLMDHEPVLVADEAGARYWQ